jgi:hypothetical protein
VQERKIRRSGLVEGPDTPDFRLPVPNQPGAQSGGQLAEGVGTAHLLVLKRWIISSVMSTDSSA